MLLHIRRFTIAQLVARRLRLGWVLWIFFSIFFSGSSNSTSSWDFPAGYGRTFGHDSVLVACCPLYICGSPLRLFTLLQLLIFVLGSLNRLVEPFCLIPLPFSLFPLSSFSHTFPIPVFVFLSYLGSYVRFSQQKRNERMTKTNNPQSELFGGSSHMRSSLKSIIIYHISYI